MSAAATATAPRAAMVDIAPAAAAAAPVAAAATTPSKWSWVIGGRSFDGRLAVFFRTSGLAKSLGPALVKNAAEIATKLGRSATEGLMVVAHPELRKAQTALLSDELRKALEARDMAFVFCLESGLVIDTDPRYTHVNKTPFAKNHYAASGKSRAARFVLGDDADLTGVHASLSAFNTTFKADEWVRKRVANGTIKQAQIDALRRVKPGTPEWRTAIVDQGIVYNTTWSPREFCRELTAAGELKDPSELMKALKGVVSETDKAAKAAMGGRARAPAAKSSRKRKQRVVRDEAAEIAAAIVPNPFVAPVAAIVAAAAEAKADEDGGDDDDDLFDDDGFGFQAELIERVPVQRKKRAKQTPEEAGVQNAQQAINDVVAAAAELVEQAPTPSELAPFDSLTDPTTQPIEFAIPASAFVPPTEEADPSVSFVIETQPPEIRALNDGEPAHDSVRALRAAQPAMFGDGVVDVPRFTLWLKWLDAETRARIDADKQEARVFVRFVLGYLSALVGYTAAAHPLDGLCISKAVSNFEVNAYLYAMRMTGASKRERDVVESSFGSTLGACPPGGMPLFGADGALSVEDFFGLRE